MKILNRYLFENLLRPMVYLIVAFSLLFIVGDLMDNASEFMEADTGPAEMVYYYTLRLPSMVIMIVPICLLLAVLYSLSTLTRHSEITAMRASGISIYRIVRPYLLMGVICFLFTAVVNEYTGPKFAYRADQFVEDQKHNESEVYFEQIAFRNPAANHIWYIKQFDTRSYTMQGVELVQQRDDGSDLRKYNAARARWIDGRWWFEEGSLQQFDRQGNRAGPAETFEILEMRKLPEQPADFMADLKPAEYRSSLEQWNYIQANRHLSIDTLTSEIVDFHKKLTEPVVCIIVILIGIPVGAHTGRKGAFAGIMLALGMFFAFYATQFFMIYLAKEMFIIPWVGPWGAVIAFLIIGLIMVHRMR